MANVYRITRTGDARYCERPKSRLVVAYGAAAAIQTLTEGTCSGCFEEESLQIEDLGDALISDEVSG